MWQVGIFSEVSSFEVVIIEMNPRSLSTWVLIVFRRATKRKTIVWGHAWPRSGTKGIGIVFRTLMMSLADIVVVYSVSQKNELDRLVRGLRIFAAPNSLVKRADCLAAVESVQNMNRILYVGRLTPAKKPRLLLEAFALVINHLPSHINLTFVGSGTEAESLSVRITELGLNHRVSLVGHVSNSSHLRKLYGESICAVSPGYIGLAAIQALAHGVCLIVADNEPHAPEIEACEVENNTIFFDANNASSLADCITQVWRERQSWWFKRELFCQNISSNYSIEKMVDTFNLAIYGGDGNESII